MTSTPVDLRRAVQLSPLLRLLMVTQLAFNIGFFAVLPFLSEHLGQAVGMASTAGLLPSAAFVVLLTIGQMLVVPVARAWVPDLAEEGRLGLYTGALSSVSGLIVLAGTSVTGSLLDATCRPRCRGCCWQWCRSRGSVCCCGGRALWRG